MQLSSRLFALLALVLLATSHGHLKASSLSHDGSEKQSINKSVSSTEDAENIDINSPFHTTPLKPKASSGAKSKKKSKPVRAKRSLEESLTQPSQEPQADQLHTEMQEILKSLNRGNSSQKHGHPSDRIVAEELAQVIRQRSNNPDQREDFLLFKEDGIRYVVLDTEWDRDRNITEVSAIEFINGKRGRVLFKKYNHDAPAAHDIKAILDFIKDNPATGLVTITVAHNAPADFNMLLHEMFKHFHAAHTGGHTRIQEHEVFTTYWLDTYRYLQRKAQIEQGNHQEQVKIKPVVFSLANALAKDRKAKEDRAKREQAKKRKAARERNEELRLIEDGLLQSDGSFAQAVDSPEDEENVPAKISFKLGEAFARTGIAMEDLQKKLRIPPQLPREKGIAGNDFDAHNALYDILMTVAVIKAEIDELRDEYPGEIARKLIWSPSK